MNNTDLTQTLVDGLLKDRKTDRRWRNIRFFIVIGLILLYIAIAMFMSGKTTRALGFNPQKPYVALVRMQGTIMVDKPFSAATMIPLLQKAFSDTKARGVVLEINSPGGSPVQSAIIHDKIIELKHRYHKPVVVLGVDSLASGAYLVASSADRIYVNQDTITGSIGVLMSGFGFTDAIKKLGITRRVFTAGENKVRLDPFEPVTPASKNKINHVLEQVHQHFIHYVIQGRGERLHGNPKKLFSGDFWTGDEAVKLGLADGTGQLWTVLRKDFKVEQYRDYSYRPSLLRDIVNDLRASVGFSLAQHLSPISAKLNT